MKINEVNNKYTITAKIKLGYNYILTKLSHPQQRIIRQPFTVRGKRMIEWGRGLTTGVGCRIEAFVADDDRSVKLTFGDRIQINDYVHISALQSVTIGNDVLMASHVYIYDNSHGCYKGNDNDTSPEISPAKRPYYVSPVIIGDRVWLGEGVIVMPGVSIGDGAVVGAHSVVNSNIPANCIATGSPAKIIKQWNQAKKRWERI